MIIRWTDTFQRQTHVYSTSTFTLRLIRRIFYVESTSILRRKVSVRTGYIFQRRFKIDSTSKSTCADMIFFQRRFNVGIPLSIRPADLSTSNIRRCFPNGIGRFSDVEYTSIQRRNFPVHKAYRFFFVEYTSIPRRVFLTVGRFDVEISQSIRPVDSSTSNIRRFHVDVSPR